MTSNFVSLAKTTASVLLNLHQRLLLPYTIRATTQTRRSLSRTFVDKTNIALVTGMKRFTMRNIDTIEGDTSLKSTGNRCNSIQNVDGNSMETTKTQSSTTNPIPITGKGGNEKSLYEDCRAASTMQQPGGASPHISTKNENKYSVQTENGFMKISMMPSSTPYNGIAEKAYSHVNNYSNSHRVEKFENQKQPSNGQETYRNQQTQKIPETVLQYQRQLRKTQAAKRASTPLLKSQLQIVHNDDHIVVVNKPSGVLTVPGINSNPSMTTLLYEEYKHELDPEMKPEHMIVHRLDMDTSGIVVYAKTKETLLSLQALFRDREGVSKYYEAVVCGHVNPKVEGGSIDLPLQRDHRFPPFMRVATPKSEQEAQQVVKDLKNAGWKKIVKKRPKPSQTLFEVIGREYVYSNGDLSVDEKGCDEKGELRIGKRYPVTRLRLTPITGRTHQLRVHCASIGHPILGDPTYGIYGEASPNGGFEDDLMDELVPGRASIDLQLSLDQYTKDKGQVMCLHARELHVKHPGTGESLVFERPAAF